MTGEALRRGQISEEKLAEALTAARGDIFIAACSLACTPRELDRYIKASPAAQVVVMAVSKAKEDTGYARYSQEQFDQRVAELQNAYRLDGLEAIHDIASIPMDEAKGNAMMLSVKLQAAVALRGAPQAQTMASDTESLLAQLSQEYREKAPRIRRIRAVEIEIDQGLLE